VSLPASPAPAPARKPRSFSRTHRSASHPKDRSRCSVPGCPWPSFFSNGEKGPPLCLQHRRERDPRFTPYLQGEAGLARAEIYAPEKSESDKRTVATARAHLGPRKDRNGEPTVALADALADVLKD